MSKRRPDYQLTQENWEDEVGGDQDENGVFQKANPTELKNRVFRVAKRRLQRTDESDSNNPGSVSNNPSAFSGISLLSKSSTTGTDTLKAAFSFGNNSATNTFLLSSQSSGSSSSIKPSESARDSKNSSKFEAKLKELNTAVFECIKGHVNSGKLCILSPIFKDYDKYVADIKKDDANNTSAPKDTNSVEKAPMFSFSFNANKPATANDSSTEKSSLPSIAPASPPKSSAPTPMFSFGNTAPAFSSAAQGFGSTSSGFLFSSAVQQATQPAKTDNGGKSEGANGTAEVEESDEPPKVEFTPVVEESIYSKRCKVFVKDDGGYKDRGTGTLYLKSVKDDKVQLLVRADTNLGNILLNFLLAPGMPAKLMKNNVVMVCIPTPDSDPKPKSILIRVKTEDDATELLGEIQKFVN